MTSSAGVEYFTPLHILQAARDVLGAIDLDPASCAVANDAVQAARYYSAAENGLLRPWYGRLWLNPPFGDLLPRFVERLCWCYRAAHVSAALLLVPARVDTRWWRLLQECPVCFIDGRLRFANVDNSAPFATAVVYFGSHEERFAQTFGRLGLIYRCVSPLTTGAAVQGQLEFDLHDAMPLHQRPHSRCARRTSVAQK